MNGPDLLVVGAVGVAGGDDDGVGAFPERQREVQRDRSGRGRLVQARNFAAVHGHQDACHPLRTRDDAGEGHRILLHAGLVQGRGKEHREGHDLGDTPVRNPPGSRHGQLAQIRTTGGRRALSGSFVEDGAGLLGRLAIRIRCRDQEDVLARTERGREVDANNRLRTIRRLQPGHLRRVQGDGHQSNPAIAGPLPVTASVSPVT